MRLRLRELRNAGRSGILVDMGFGVRVLFNPLANVSREGTHLDGGHLVLETLGTAGSNATNAPQAARIALVGTFFDRARAASPIDVRPLGELNGNIELGPDGTVTFTGDGQGFTGVDTALDIFRSPNPPRLPPDQRIVRVLRFRCEQPQFFDTFPDGDTESELLVTIDSKVVRFLEIGVTLEVAGAVEADDSTNAKLDIAVTPTNPPLLQLLSVRLHDTAATPFPAAAARVTLPGQTLDLVGDAEGFITFLLPNACPPSIGLDWGPAPGDQPLHADLAIDCSAQADGSEVVARLQNLGYPALQDLSLSVKAFQRAYEVDHLPVPLGLLPGNQLPARTRARLQGIFSNGCDATPNVSEEA